MPEYSYYLNSGALASIRDYNDGLNNKYEVTATNLNIYAETKIYKNKESDRWLIQNDDERIDNIKFVHYGSKFVENFLNDYVTESYRGQTLDSIVVGGNAEDCYITEEEYENYLRYPSEDKSALETALGSKKCRWVDYVIETKDSSGNKTGEAIRLAFK